MPSVETVIIERIRHEQNKIPFACPQFANLITKATRAAQCIDQKPAGRSFLPPSGVVLFHAKDARS